MRKFSVITLSCVIVLLSFAFCFADGGSPVILPVSSDGTVGLNIELDNDSTHAYSSNNSPAYIAWYMQGSQKRILCFSELDDTIVYNYNVDSHGLGTYSLSQEYNGFYYSNTVSALPVDDSYMLGEFSSPQEAMDYIKGTIFSTTFDLITIVNGSVDWVSSMAQAVKTNGLLLFFVLFIFVGVGIGLFRRFTN